VNKKVYIVDLIGTHSGMHYYHNAFKDLFKNESTIDIKILSNYKIDNKYPFFKNIFVNSFVINVINLFFSVLKLFFFILINRKSYFVYLTYGSLFDLPFLFLCFFFKERFIIDIHEIYDLASPPPNLIRRIFDLLYKKIISNVIIHSDKTKVILKNIGFHGFSFFVPHFKYVDESDENDSCDLDIKNLFKKDKLNIVFFGHIRISKGIDDFFNLVNSISDVSLFEKVHFVIAGNDTDNIIGKNNLIFKKSISNSILLRRISDNELNYIFKNTNYVILPYKEISQSGIVEMAIKFKTPMILSDIPEFNSYLSHYKSFGHIFNVNNDFEFFLKEIIFQANEYYQIDDLSKYNSSELFDKFKIEFKKYLI
jgi:glycosyltransferase involved in cell wall biosynthesis